MSPRAARALLAAGCCAAGLVVVFVAAFWIGATERADDRVFLGFLGLGLGRTRSWAELVTHGFDPAPFALAVLIVLAAAARLRGPRMVAATGAILLGASVSTQLLKLLTDPARDPLSVPATLWPSGHVTSATSLALCVVLIAPVALRPYAVGAGALGVLGVAYSILVIGSHHPSDVLGGMLMAGAWTGLAVAALERRPAHSPVAAAAIRRRGLWLAPAAAAIAVFALLVVVAAVEPLRPYLTDHTTFLAGAVVLAGCGALVPAVAGTLAV